MMGRNKKYKCTLLVLFACLLVSCSRNDFSEEYQKELLYDGYNVAVDTLFINTYSAFRLGDSISKGDLYSSITRWYDLNGYNSMTKSIVYKPSGEHETLEKVTRDKKSLAIARDISISSPNTETIVTLARLKKRKDGEEEWLFRHYIDPKKYIEDVSYIFYTSDGKTTKKKDRAIDSLKTIETDFFDPKGRLLERHPSQQDREEGHLTNFYSEQGYLDSVISKVYVANNVDNGLLRQHTERYKYDVNERGVILKSYTFYNDSLVSISEYKYAYRE